MNITDKRRTIAPLALCLGLLAPAAAAAGSVYHYKTIDPFGAAYVLTAGVNNSGEIVGSYGNASQTAFQGFTDINGVFTSIDDPHAAAGLTAVFGVSNTGVITGTYETKGGKEFGFIDDRGHFTKLSDPFAAPAATVANFSYVGTTVTGINAAGEAVGTYTDASGGLHAFSWTARGGYTTLDDPAAAPGSTLTAYNAINGAGVISGGYVDPGGVPHGFIESGGVFTPIDDPAGPTVYATTSDNGLIVGGYFVSPGFASGYLDKGGVFTNIADPLGVGGSQADGVNDHGVIVGDYLNAAGQFQGFAASVPEPATWALMFMGVGLAGGALRRRRLTVLA